MAHYLVTGGAGFIGSNIVEELVKRGEKVRVLDNFITGKMENLKSFLDKIELIEGDIRDREVLKKALNGIDFVLHQAALRSVPKSVENPFLTNDINVFGTLNLLMAAKEAKVKRLVYASSSSAYGDAKRFPQKETDLPVPISPYAVSKLAGENYCVVFAKTFGLETVSLRYFNVFGPRQHPESQYAAVIPKFMQSALRGQPLEVHWDGKQSRDFTYIDNVVQANLLAASASGVSAEAFNIASGKSISLLHVIAALEKSAGRRLERRHTPPRSGDVRKTWADIRKAKKRLRYQPRIDFAEGLRRTWAWFQKQPLNTDD